MSRPVLGVVTIAHGRHDHLVRQQQSLRSGLAPDVRIVVAIDDPQIAGLIAELAPDATVVSAARQPDSHSDGLPLAAARNAGARAALDRGATRLVFLDVDCLVDAHTVAAYGEPDPEPGAVWCGPVTYLPESDGPHPLADLTSRHDPHPARPDPGPGHCLVDDRWQLFWSLSFALDADTWDRVGGFDEAYRGYGGEDTDFGQRAAHAGCRLVWTGSPRAYHQWHPTSTPPVQHRDDILRNAALFHDRWGWWPMSGWLHALADLGLVERVDGRWAATQDFADQDSAGQDSAAAPTR